MKKFIYENKGQIKRNVINQQQQIDTKINFCISFS